eukprot:CAMPEP_0170562926 /NCGR_PEP_ID=MMETSP0211-20121228/63287_1 /TAXON_ID=311385 /ORGANISM="Pseudokeronopsis sp., Strain OXSARD2" /LENGTH=79 /DNA_ID=CAMNT_0010880471 /DNA_START=120 /DNA_END=355 /DNA_ORIENTATION=+
MPILLILENYQDNENAGTAFYALYLIFYYPLRILVVSIDCFAVYILPGFLNYYCLAFFEIQEYYEWKAIGLKVNKKYLA